MVAAACIVDRSGGKADVGVPLITLASLEVLMASDPQRLHEWERAAAFLHFQLAVQAERRNQTDTAHAEEAVRLARSCGATHSQTVAVVTRAQTSGTHGEPTELSVPHDI